MILMPLGIGVFFLFSNFPAGVLIYWVTTNIWTIGQQLVVKRIIAAKESREEALALASGGTVSRPASRGQEDRRQRWRKTKKETALT